MTTSARAGEAISRARQAILGRQREDGAWSVSCHAGPASTAHVTVALRFLGRLTDDDAAATVRWLEEQWLGPGRGFEGYPGAGAGDLGATAVVWAALHACGLPARHPVVSDARDFVQRQGGEAALLRRFRQGDLAALFLAMVGLYPAERLPTAPGAMLLPGIERAIENRLNVIIPFTLIAADAIVRHLRSRPTVAGALANLLGSLEARRALAHFDRYRNDDGSWLYGDTYHAALVLAALHALGVPADHPSVAGGLAFLAGKRRARPTGDRHVPGQPLCYPIFDTDVWTTAFLVRALLQAGQEPGDPAISAAVAWLCDCQRRGAWAFQRWNSAMPDCDDAGVVIATLALALDPRHGQPLPAELAARARTAVCDGRRWLFARQNREGGWASFQSGLPGKGRGPIMTGPPPVPDDGGLWSYLTLLTSAPPELGDPATEDVTGRVLYGLGRSGSTMAEREIARAVAFLRALQDTNGGWWGRWTVNYLASTAWVLRGLRAVGADLEEAWLRRGRDFLVEHQNPDGGWGESAASYRDLGLIARGPSTPGLTGLVLSALLEVGHDGEPVKRGLDFLLETQERDGTWPRKGELHSLLPPALFYELPETENQLALEALGIWRRGPAVTAAARPPSPPLPPRALGDPHADELARRLFERGDLGQVNGLFRILLHPADPLPAELPEDARAYFLESALPAWADPLKLEEAHRLFARCGFAVATALFSSSLPQCFAFPAGARVLAATSSFEAGARRRVLETAQFVFDVAARGGLSPDGRGVRAAQKVRLMHAAVRLLVRRRGWDEARDGVPVNQEQMLGTTLAFSTVVIDALRAMGFEVRDDEAEAWFHLWRVVGVLLGLEERFLPLDAAAGAARMEELRGHWGPSAEGAAQARATLAVMQEILPGKQFDGLPVALVRHLAGHRCADLLELPRADGLQWVIEGGALLLDAIPRRLGRSAFAATAQQASFAIMKALGELNLEHRPAGFHVPAELRDRWLRDRRESALLA